MRFILNCYLSKFKLIVLKQVEDAPHLLVLIATPSQYLVLPNDSTNISPKSVVLFRQEIQSHCEWDLSEDGKAIRSTTFTWNLSSWK